MDTSKLNLLVYDSKENFDKTKSQLGYEGSTLKRIILIENIHQLDSCITSQLSNEDFLFLVVHVFALDKIKGIKEFLASGIKEKYPSLEFMYISEGASDKEIKKQMIEHDIELRPIFRYHQVLTELRADRFKAFTKTELLQPAIGISNSPQSIAKSLISPKNDFPRCDYAIITALEEDEMEKILPMIEKEGETSNTKHLIEYGHLIKNPKKKIAYASQQSTGMIDAAILATELLTTFKPKFLIMPGVLGGKPNDVNIGDIIVSTKVFTIDKGKLTTEEILKDETVKEQIDFVEKEVEEGKKVFKKEIEAVTMNSSAITKFIRKKDGILNYINNEDQTRKKIINLLFGPIACVRQVIDQKGYFEENILVIERKAIGLEMESYSVARACELVNNGETTPIIVKSVMDNTAAKVDEAKTYAAWTSAMFVKYILENDLI